MQFPNWLERPINSHLGGGGKGERIQSKKKNRTQGEKPLGNKFMRKTLSTSSDYQEHSSPCWHIEDSSALMSNQWVEIGGGILIPVSFREKRSTRQIL